MRLFLIYISIILAWHTVATSQITFTNDTIVGDNSELVNINLSIENNSNNIDISFDIVITNPTLVFLTKVNEDLNINTSQITPKGDGIFAVFISTKGALSSFSIVGKLLSGNDSLTQVFVKNIKIGGIDFPSDSAIVKNIFFDKTGVYVRFFESTPPFPNPLYPNETISIEVYNDISTEIRFIVYDIRGYVHLEEVVYYEKGKNTYQFVTKDYPAGAYYISIITNIGETYEKFVVRK